jgi:acetolactate synthase regulatory subunit
MRTFRAMAITAVRAVQIEATKTTAMKAAEQTTMDLVNRAKESRRTRTAQVWNVYFCHKLQWSTLKDS